MKIGGRTLTGEPNKVTLVLPRPPFVDPDTGEEIDQNILIVAQAISDFGALDTLLEEPKPPAALSKGGVTVYNKKDPTYIAHLAQYHLQKMAFIVIKSLEPSGLIEWDTVDIDDPLTWLNYVEDFRKAGLSQIEINRICNACMEANCLDEEKLNAARALFLRGQAEGKSTSGQNS